MTRNRIPLSVRTIVPALLIFFIVGCGSGPETLTGTPGSGIVPDTVFIGSGSTARVSEQNVYAAADGEGFAVIFGEVRNTGNTSTFSCDIAVSVKVTTTLGTESTIAIPLSGRTMLLSGKTNDHCLKGGETGAFQYATDIPFSLIADLEVTELSLESQNIQVSPLESDVGLVDAVTETTTDDLRQFSGSVRNTDTALTAYFPKITFVTRDAAGLVIGVFTQFLNLSLEDTDGICQLAGVTGDVPCLPPGGSLSFAVDAEGLIGSEIADSDYFITWMEAGDFE